LLGAHTPDEAVAARLANHATNLDAELVLVCDPDAAGRRVADALAPLLEQQGHAPTVVTPPNGCDLSDWAQSDDGWVEQLLSQVLTDPDLAIEAPGAKAISNDIEL
jgi:hypothetical protein